MSLDIDLHGRRTAWLTTRLCEELGIAEHETDDIAQAALTHDIGKLDLSAELLDKPLALTGEERLTIQRHCMLGARRLAVLSDEDTDQSTTLPIAVALSHHEWWNGNGYPFGLAGTAIPRAARIVAVADVFDALATVRAYKRAWSIPDAVDYVAAGRGTQFDPQVVDAMLAVARDLAPDWMAAAQSWVPGPPVVASDFRTWRNVGVSA